METLLLVISLWAILAGAQTEATHKPGALTPN
jgi:hypothetical protein